MYYFVQPLHYHLQQIGGMKFLIRSFIQNLYLTSPVYSDW